MTKTNLMKMREMESVLMESRRLGNSKPVDEKFTLKCGVTSDCYSVYSGSMVKLYLAIREYAQPRRDESCVSATNLETKTRNALRKDVIKAWTEVLSVNEHLVALPEDVEMLWHAIERVEKNSEKQVIVGINTPVRFARQVEIELGLRLADIHSKSEVELEHESALLRLTNRISSLEKTAGELAADVEKWEDTLEMFKNTNATEEQLAVIRVLQSKAEDDYTKAISDLKAARDEKSKMEEGGLELTRDKMNADFWAGLELELR